MFQVPDAKQQEIDEDAEMAPATAAVAAAFSPDVARSNGPLESFAMQTVVKEEPAAAMLDANLEVLFRRVCCACADEVLCM